MRAETDPRGGLGRDAMGPPRSRSLNLDDPGGSLGLPRPVHPAGPEESAHDALPTRSLDSAHPAPPTGCTGPAAALSVGRSGGTTKFTKAARSLVTETGHLHLLTTDSSQTIGFTAYRSALLIFYNGSGSARGADLGSDGAAARSGGGALAIEWADGVQSPACSY